MLITSFIKSVRFALQGLKVTKKGHRNLKIQYVCGVISILLGVITNINLIEWCMVILSLGMVIGLELVNTAIETLLNEIHPARNPQIGKAKDIAAAAVLIAALCAVAIGCLIFVPKIINMVQ